MLSLVLAFRVYGRFEGILIARLHLPTVDMLSLESATLKLLNFLGGGIEHSGSFCASNQDVPGSISLTIKIIAPKIFFCEPPVSTVGNALRNFQYLLCQFPTGHF